ncbi:hypothetical protein TSUD_351240 [Trifolium subterraneum]|uniref:NB-ARC domain-containing protein n=1 Tax=Trifolium subterraneum TaxID=3900 RepID=A0A2Z6P4P3_TRISU|nr:hypothetical protein TSUD_351240 [Trifolium subterraneum]
MRRLRCIKAFVVLDSLNSSKLLENLIGVGCGWLRGGSTVIVTTRNRDVLMRGGVDEIYEVRKMNIQYSLRLFSLNAFDKPQPKQGFDKVSRRAVVYAKGSFIHSKSKEEWDRALAKLMEVPNAEIQRVLRLSYDKL